MNRTELSELIHNRESSGVEFKRDDVRPERLAKEVAAFLNLMGGQVLLGVEDDGRVSGLTRDPRSAEEWVMEVCRIHLQPAVIPFWETVEWEPGVIVGVVSLPAGAPDKPYKSKRGAAWVTKTRAGTTTRDATREEEQRLYQQSGSLRYGLKPVPGTTLEALDLRRLRDYLMRILGDDPPDDEDAFGWERLLTIYDLMTDAAGRNVPAVDGVLLFGRTPKRYLPQSGIRALCYPGREPDYAVLADENLVGPIVGLFRKNGELEESGLLEQALDFVRRNTTPSAELLDGRRVDRWPYPEAALREGIANALVHRDYSIIGTDITLTIFADRLEIQSPGRLPNTVTVDGMKAGLRYARNQTLVNILRDYDYVDFRGMGVRKKLIPAMREHNGTEPDLIEEDARFTVRLWKDGSD